MKHFVTHNPDGTPVFLKAEGMHFRIEGGAERAEITETEYKRKDAKRLTRLGSHPTELRRNSTAPGAV